MLSSDLSTSDGWKDDSRGYYEDGAYIAAPVAGPHLPTGYDEPDENTGMGGNATEISPQEAYTKQLLALFEAQKKAIQSLCIPKGTPSHGPRKYTPGAIKHMLKDETPTPAQFYGLSQSNVLKMLDHARTMLKRKKNIDSRFSAWLWGLLCKLDTVGTLDCDAVSIVRELGKKMVWVGIGFFNDDTSQVINGLPGPEENSPDPSALNGDDEALEDIMSEEMDLETDCELEQEHEEPHDQDIRRNTSSPIQSTLDVSNPVVNDSNRQPPFADNLETARSLLIKALEDDTSADAVQSKLPCPDTNTLATLDAIITIIGELYGQRDLLEFRSFWGGENGLWG